MGAALSTTGTGRSGCDGEGIPVSLWGAGILGQNLPNVRHTDKVIEKVTDLLRKDSGYTTTMLAEMLGISRKTVSKRLKSLKEKVIGNFFCNRGVTENMNH